MFCKNCGAKLEDNAKFCASCGQKVGSQEYTAPKPFEKNSVDGSQNYQYQKSTFKGAQFSTGTSGQVSFGGKGKKKKSFLGRLFGLALVVVIVVVVWQVFFPGGPIRDLQTSTSIDSVTFEAIDSTSTFSTTTPVIYTSFNVSGLDEGQIVTVEWWYMSTDPWTFIDDYNITVTEDSGYAYSSMNTPNGGWPVGDYDVDLYVDGEYVITISFVVE